MNIKHHLNNSTNDEFHMQTSNNFPLQINTQNNMSSLKLFNEIRKKIILNLVVVMFVMKRNINLNFKHVKQ
jgi:hypothetical protein